MSLISTRGCQDISLELESPYDIQVFDDPEGREILSDYIALAGEDYTVRSSYLFDVYKDPGMHLQPIVSVPGSNTDFDTVISLGTYNELLKLRGLSPGLSGRGWIPHPHGPPADPAL